MGPAELQAHCLSRPGAWPDNPWDHEHPVIKVGPEGRGKIFAFVGDGSGGGKIFAFLGESSVGVKCGATREEADSWLERYPDDEVLEAVDESYRRVVAKLPRAHRPDGWEDV